jgi:hypothetical protein
MTRDSWLSNGALYLMSIAPLYDYDTALIAMETYLTAEAGGWVEDGGEPPGGEGAPDNEDTHMEAADTIYATEVSESVTVEVTVPVTVTLTVSGRFASAVSAETIRTNYQVEIENRIQALNEKGLLIDNIDFDTTTETFVRTTGELNPAARVAVQTHITTASEITDPVAVAVTHLRVTQALVNTWMAYRHYINNEDAPSIIFVQKYTNTSYITVDETFVDGGDTVTYEGYIVYVDRSTLYVQTVIVYPTQTRTPT